MVGKVVQRWWPTLILATQSCNGSLVNTFLFLSKYLSLLLSPLHIFVPPCFCAFFATEALNIHVYKSVYLSIVFSHCKIIHYYCTIHIIIPSYFRFCQSQSWIIILPQCIGPDNLEQQNTFSVHQRLDIHCSWLPCHLPQYFPNNFFALSELKKS